MDNEVYSAVVENVHKKGKHGPYAEASSDDLGLITFSLRLPVWEERSFPERGSIVVLSDIQKKRAGWRAKSGRFFRPSDRKPSNQKQTSKE